MRVIKKSVIKQKFNDRNIAVSQIPYLGETFIGHSQQNTKPFNKIRNILVLDFALESVFKSVDEQARNSEIVQRLIQNVDGEVNLDDIVYHCFHTRPIPKQENILDRLSCPFKIPDGKGACFNRKNIFGITEEDLSLSRELLEVVIKWCRPDIILVLGQSLQDLVNLSFYLTKKEFFDTYCQDGNVRYKTIGCEKWFDPFRKNLKDYDTIEFLKSEKTHRYLSLLNELIIRIRGDLYHTKRIVLNKEERFRYFKKSNNSSSDILDIIVSADDSIVGDPQKEPITESTPKNLIDNPDDDEIWTLKQDMLIKSLDDIKGKIEYLNHFKDTLLAEGKNYYLPHNDSRSREEKNIKD